MSTTEAVEIIPVTETKIWCDGTLAADGTRLDPSLGHPKVFLNMGSKDHADCPYCGKRFQLEK